MTTFFFDLQAGRSSSTIEVRLIRFWEARNFRRGDELMGVDMLLLDAQSTMVSATIHVNRLSTHQSNLEAGAVYSLTNFDVTRCGQNYRLTDSPLLIRFSEATSFTKVAEASAPIPLHSFRFRNYSELLGLASSNTQLPDVIGEITGVKSTVIEPHHDKNRVMVTIKMENDTSVTMSLFDSQAVGIHKQLERMVVDPRVIVATSVNPKMVGGRLFLNATSGTHIYFDKETSAGEQLFYRLVEHETGLRPVASLLKSYSKVEKISISELNDFVLTAASQEADFICAGDVTGIKFDKGWCYVSCSKCFKKLQRSGSSLACLSCNNTNAVGVLRYRVEMSIADKTGEGLFVGFDGVMAKLFNMRAQDAATVLVRGGDNPEESDFPQFVKEMVGKSITFQVKVGPYNFTSNHQSFTIARIIREGEHAPRPDFVDGGDNGGKDDAGRGSGRMSGEMEAGGGSKSGGSANEDVPVKKARKV